MSTQETEGRQRSQFLIPIREYESPASRIRGFQALFNYGLRAPEPMLVVGHQAFQRYEASGDMIPEVTAEIVDAYRTIREANPNRGAYIGRAFYVPGIDNPNGPRTAAIRDEEQYMQEVVKFWDFVIQNGYNVSGSDIALILHPFLHVMDPSRTHYGNMLLSEDEQLPFGAGYLVSNPQPGRPNLIRILALDGTDEAVVSCPHDVYDVDPDTETIVSKKIAFKDITYVPGLGNEYGVLPIPLRFQNAQALTDREILSIASDVKNVLRENSFRIEFATQPDGNFYREIAPWNPQNPRELLKLQSGESITQPVIRIDSVSDIDRIKDSDAIVYFPPAAYRLRTTDLFARVAQLPHVQRMVALTYGTIETSHMARVLSDAGRSVMLVGDQEFIDGTNLRVSRDENGLPKIEYLNPYEGTIIPLSDITTLSKGEAGQKVGRLAIMKQFGITVPDGFCLRSKAVWQYLDEIGLGKKIALLDSINIQNQDEVERIAYDIQQVILESHLPPDLEQQIGLALEKYDFKLYAIRSSGSEDEDEQSHAGLYESSVGVKPEEVSNRIRKTIASYFSPVSITLLRQSSQLPSLMTIGVGIHEFIPDTVGTTGAVIFTYPDSILIEATQGSPEGIVSGTVKDYWKVTISRMTGKASIEPVGKPNIPISEEQTAEAVEITKQIENIFKSHQDIELLMTPDRGIVVLQARPL